MFCCVLYDLLWKIRSVLVSFLQKYVFFFAKPWLAGFVRYLQPLWQHLVLQGSLCREVSGWKSRVID